MFLVNGKLLLVNGKPFFNPSHISCGFFKYAWCIFKATEVFTKYVCIKTTYQMLKHITITLKLLNKRRKQNVCIIALNPICPKIIL